MNEIRLAGLLRERYKNKFFGLVHKFSYPVLGYSLTSCSYPNNLSSHPIRDCSMHSPLRVKIQNALNKAFQLEHTDVLFVGGRRRNRKRRKHAKDKKKSKKYEGKETPVLKAKTYNGNNGKYIALLADDDISLSPSMVDDLLDGTSFDAVSLNKDEEINDKRSIYDEIDCDEDTKEIEYESSGINNDEVTLQDELDKANDRHSSCDTGYNSEEEKASTNSDSQDEGDKNTDEETDSLLNAEIFRENKAYTTTTDDDVFFLGQEETVAENILDSNTEILLSNHVTVSGTEDSNVFIEPENTETQNTKELTATNREIEEKLEHETKADKQVKGVTINKQTEIFQSDYIKDQLRITANFDYEEEDEEEIYTKQPKSWFRGKKEKDEELRPLICCGDETGVGLACCTIL